MLKERWGDREGSMKWNERKENSVSELHGNFCSTIVRQDYSFPCRRHFLATEKIVNTLNKQLWVLLFLWFELTLPVKCQLQCYLNVGIWARLLFLNKLLSIIHKLVGNKVQIFYYPGKQAEAVNGGRCKTRVPFHTVVKAWRTVPAVPTEVRGLLLCRQSWPLVTYS